ncbi:MAG: DedA family protein [Pirellulales bacterium]|nr:DedA family protein [Pirellulales bacterium]
MDLLVTQGKYLGIILFLILTGCGLPIPEEVPIVLAGVLSAHGKMDPTLAYFSCLIGALVGDSVMYTIGYHWGHSLFWVHPRLGKWLHAEREEKFEKAVQRHGLKVMILARFMVGIRGPAYLAAGVIRIPFRRFLLMDLVAATLVVSLFFGLSHAFGNQIVQWIHGIEYIATTVVVVVVIIAVIYWRRHRPIARVLLKSAAPEAASALEADIMPPMDATRRGETPDGASNQQVATLEKNRNGQAEKQIPMQIHLKKP